MKKLIAKINNSNELMQDTQTKWVFLKTKFEYPQLIIQKLLLKYKNNRDNLELNLKNRKNNKNSAEKTKLRITKKMSSLFTITLLMT